MYVCIREVELYTKVGSNLLEAYHIDTFLNFKMFVALMMKFVHSFHDLGLIPLYISDAPFDR